jgi:branched-subunit amino acid aminotransferase/4-amino-4-deoxychorismate lyase
MSYHYNMLENNATPLPSGTKLLSSILYTSCSFFLIDHHYDRLVASCKRLGWTAPERQDLERALYGAIAKQAHLTLRIRLLYDEKGHFQAEAFPWQVQKNLLGPLAPADAQAAHGHDVPAAQSWTLYLDSQPTDVDLRLIINKTTSREHYEQPCIRLKTAYTDRQEVLLFNAQNLVTEGTITNVAFRREEKWVTPCLKSGCLPGVTRRFLLEKGLIIEREVKVSELQDGERVLLFNALRGVFEAKLDLKRRESLTAA